LENQVHFFSLSFAGEKWGGSIVVPPWIDETRGENYSPQTLDQQEGTLCLKLDPAEAGGAAEIAATVRKEFSFKADAFFPPPEQGSGGAPKKRMRDEPEVEGGARQRI